MRLLSIAFVFFDYTDKVKLGFTDVNFTFLFLL